MSFGELYRYVQENSKSLPVSRRFIAPKLSELTGSPKPRVMKTEMDTTRVRGYFVSPSNPDHPLAKWCVGGAPIIVVARSLNYCWERFVTVKELMHLFDTEEQKVDSGISFSELLDEFSAPLPERSDAMDSEVMASWMALALLCPEAARLGYAERRSSGMVTDLQIATDLRIPEQYVSTLFERHFSVITKMMIDVFAKKAA